MKITYPPGAYANIAKTRDRTADRAALAPDDDPESLPRHGVRSQPRRLPRRLGGRVRHRAHAAARTTRSPGRPTWSPTATGPSPTSRSCSRAKASTVDPRRADRHQKRHHQNDVRMRCPTRRSRTFELNLPEGPHSALAANVEPVLTDAADPAHDLTGQNGAVIKQNTNIAVTGCPPTVAITKAKLVGQRPAGDGQDRAPRAP